MFVSRPVGIVVNEELPVVIGKGPLLLGEPGLVHHELPTRVEGYVPRGEALLSRIRSSLNAWLIFRLADRLVQGLEVNLLSYLLIGTLRHRLGARLGYLDVEPFSSGELRRRRLDERGLPEGLVLLQAKGKERYLFLMKQLVLLLHRLLLLVLLYLLEQCLVFNDSILGFVVVDLFNWLCE